MDKNYLLKKWLSGTLSEEESQAFKKLDDYDLHIRLTEKAKNFKASEFLNPSDFETLESRLSSRPKAVNKFRRVKVLMRFAAIFIIAIGIYFAFFSNNQTRVETLIGEKTTAILPDASEVVLNSVSEIQYAQKKWDKKRELTLTGEAYFKVAKGSIFDVLTEAGKVSVLGTMFNVKNRPGYFEVVCYQGSVGVTYEGTLEKLLPGHVFRVLQGEISLDTIQNTQPYWLEKTSNFKEVPFYEVIHELERQYGVKVDVNSVDVDRIFKGGFVHGNLDMALESITKPLGLTYVIQSPNRVVLKNSE